MKILICGGKVGLYLLLAVLPAIASGQQLYEAPARAQSRLSSFENLNGVKGNGGKTNQTGKGNAFKPLLPGNTKTLLDIRGEGIIQRIWLTIDQDPVKLRSIRLQMFWDDAVKPAVDVPLGDFFCYNVGRPVAFESAFFSSGEGRSFNCYIPMPFRRAARVLLVNEGSKAAKLYFDIDYVLQKISPASMYFHAYWSRQSPGNLGDDVQVLPKLNGKGRFLGMSVGLITDSSYSKSWWGEGEVKMYIDGDGKYPTINGTGAEDYMGSAWGLGKFINQYQGCTVANDSTREFNFYRWHVPDAIYFDQDIRVTIQQIGGWMRDDLRELVKGKVNLKPITIDGPAGFVRLLDLKDPPLITDQQFADGWVDFYRIDDYSSVGYFYLNKPSNNLPALEPVETRIRNVK